MPICEYYSTRRFHETETNPYDIIGGTMAYFLRGVKGESGFIEGNLSFGRALGKKIAGGVDNGSLVVNVGDGWGDNSAGIAKELQQASKTATLVNVDLSPVLLGEQKKKAQEFINRGFIQADGLHLPFKDESVDCLACNEVIADLPSVTIDINYLADILIYINTVSRGSVTSKDELRQIISSYQGVDWHHIDVLTELARVFTTYNLDLPNRAYYDKERATVNLGAILFLEEIKRVLKKDGKAWVSEHGHIHGNEWPDDAMFHLHSEWSLKFDHLQIVAQALGFDSIVQPLAEDLGIQKDLWVVVESICPDGEDGFIWLTPDEAVRYLPAKYSDKTFTAILTAQDYTNKLASIRRLQEQMAAQGITINQIDALPNQLPINDLEKSRPPFLAWQGDVIKHFYCLELRKK